MQQTWRPALRLPWVLDLDVTVKPIYGHQEGAEVVYNPHKPGRPSHTYHTLLVRGLRQSPGVKQLVRLLESQGGWRPAGHGY